MAKMIEIKFRIICLNIWAIRLLTFLVGVADRLNIKYNWREIKDVSTSIKTIDIFNTHYMFVWTKIIWK